MRAWSKGSYALLPQHSGEGEGTLPLLPPYSESTITSMPSPNHNAATSASASAPASYWLGYFIFVDFVALFVFALWFTGNLLLLMFKVSAYIAGFVFLTSSAVLKAVLEKLGSTFLIDPLQNGLILLKGFFSMIAKDFVVYLYSKLSSSDEASSSSVPAVEQETGPSNNLIAEEQNDLLTSS